MLKYCEQKEIKSMKMVMLLIETMMRNPMPKMMLKMMLLMLTVMKTMMNMMMKMMLKQMVRVTRMLINEIMSMLQTRTWMMTLKMRL